MDNLISFLSGVAGAVIGAALSYYFTIRVGVRQQEHNTARALRQLCMEAEQITRSLAWITYGKDYQGTEDSENAQRQSRGRERRNAVLLQIDSKRYDLSDETIRGLLADVIDYCNVAESLVFQVGPRQVAADVKAIGSTAIEAINSYIERRAYEPSAEFHKARGNVALYNEIMEDQYQAQLEWEREQRQKSHSNDAEDQEPAEEPTNNSTVDDVIRDNP